MATLAQISQNLQPLKNRDELYRIALQIAARFEAYLIELNQARLSKGQDIFGRPLGTYSKKTEEIAARESTVRPKIAGQPYNFQWTGDLFAGMKVRLTADYLEIFSTDEKYDLLISKYGGFFSDNILFGLTEQDFKHFAQDKVLPELQKEVWKILQLSN